MTPIVDASTFLKNLQARKNIGRYCSMYSSLCDQITTDREAMLLPLDDHLVHRGDGVFEAFLCVEGALYDLGAHMERLKRSASAINLELPFSEETIISKIRETAKAADRENLTIRLYVSRGPGSFTANPYDNTKTQLYIVTEVPSEYPSQYYDEGVKVGISKRWAKEAPFCSIKSCDYLLNAMVKKEAIDQDLNYLIMLDKEGYVTEASTENIALINESNEFCYPSFQRSLAGTTIKRLIQIIEADSSSFGATGVLEKDLKVEDFKQAKEVFLINTTMSVMPVSEFDGVNLPKKFEFQKKFYDALMQDKKANAVMRMPL